MKRVTTQAIEISFADIHSMVREKYPDVPPKLVPSDKAFVNDDECIMFKNDITLDGVVLRWGELKQ